MNVQTPRQSLRDPKRKLKKYKSVGLIARNQTRIDRLMSMRRIDSISLDSFSEESKKMQSNVSNAAAND